MKKVLFFAVSAMFCLAACNKSEVVYDTQPQEISLLAVNKVATKAAVEDSKFPEGWTMKVAAYLAAGDGVPAAGRDYFKGTNFAKNGDYWTGGKYWPISAATLNFLAVAPENGNVTTNATSTALSSTTTVTDNEGSTTQFDVMYAVGRGSKTAGNAPTSADVDMVFQHAYCLLDFNFKTTLTPAPTITINSITVNNVACNGTLTVTTNANSPSAVLSAAHAWSGYTTANIVVPGTSLTLDTTQKRYNSGLMLIPDAPMDSFTINYTIDDQTFDYVYTRNPAVTWSAGNKYTYNITMTPALIQVDPSVAPWTESGTEVDLH